MLQLQKTREDFVEGSKMRKAVSDFMWYYQVWVTEEVTFKNKT